MQGRELDEFLDGRLHGIGDEHGFVERLAAVHHPVPDAVDLLPALEHPVLRMEQQHGDDFDGVLVVEHLADFAELVLRLALVVDDGVARADPLDYALGEHLLVLDVDQLEFHGGTAAVHNENFHGFLVLVALPSFPWISGTTVPADRMIRILPSGFCAIASSTAA